jgi:hypothetical protein
MRSLPAQPCVSLLQKIVQLLLEKLNLNRNETDALIAGGWECDEARTSFGRFDMLSNKVANFFKRARLDYVSAQRVQPIGDRAQKIKAPHI